MGALKYLGGQFVHVSVLRMRGDVPHHGLQQQRRNKIRIRIV